MEVERASGVEAREKWEKIGSLKEMIMAFGWGQVLEVSLIGIGSERELTRLKLTVSRQLACGTYIRHLIEERNTFSKTF